MRCIRLFLCLFLCSFSWLLTAQVWPGDVNNNGIANNVDLIWLGTAFHAEGPSRSMPQQGENWESKLLPVLWMDTFPNGLNYAFADCDGDGEVDHEDYEAIETNYNETHDSVTLDEFEQGIFGIDPPLFFTSIGPPMAEEGNSLVLGIDLGTADLPVNDFYGIAFTVRYDPALFSSSFGGGDFSPNDDSWIGGDNQVLDIDYQDSDQGILEVGLSRRNGQSVSGFGELGNFFIVIEDHVVGITEPELETVIYLEKVKVLDEHLNSIVIFSDSIQVTILNDTVISSVDGVGKEDVLIYPNPTQDFLWVQPKDQVIEKLELFDLVGGLINDLSAQVRSQPSFRLSLSAIPRGIYVLKITTPQGSYLKKIIING